MTTEHDNINNLSELIHTAPKELIQACVGMIHSRYGDSFATYSEVAVMLNDTSHARETLFHSGSYKSDILSFFAGARAQRLLTPLTVADALELAEPDVTFEDRTEKVLTLSECDELYGTVNLSELNERFESEAQRATDGNGHKWAESAGPGTIRIVVETY